MRKLEVKREKGEIRFYVDDNQLRVGWKTDTVDAAMKSGQLYPQLKDQLFKMLRLRLEDSSYKLTPAEIDEFVRIVKKELA